MSKVTKFQTILASTGAAVLDRRAANILKTAKAAMTNKINILNGKRDDLESQILDLTDLSVETKDSLRPGDKNFNATAWVDKLCALTLELELLDQEIEIVEAVNAEYFTEVEAEEVQA
jgi:hypothetical protein